MDIVHVADWSSTREELREGNSQNLSAYRPYR
jgi:hypothetical protein